MRLINNCLFFITVTLSLLNYSFAVTTSRNIVSKSEDGTGCTGTIASSNIGFVASVYDFNLLNHLDFYHDSWVADSYTTQDLQFTATNVTSPNFSIGWPIGATLYDNSIDASSIIVELTGYFRGMYLTFILIFVLSLNQILTFSPLFFFKKYTN